MTEGAEGASLEPLWIRALQMGSRGLGVLANDHKAVLSALIRAEHCPLILEVAATAALPFERAWYVVLALIELRFMTPAGVGLA